MSDQQIQELTPEQKEIEAIRKPFTDAPMFARWRELYFDKDNEFKLDTFKNKTTSAIIAYNLDPKNSKDRAYASELGYRNAKKCGNWARDYYEVTGMTQEKMLDVLAAKAISTNSARYFQMMAEISGVYSPVPQTAINIQQNNQTNVNDVEVKDFNSAWKRFLENEEESA